MKKVFRRPSPAMVVAIVALIAALGGTALAGGFTTKKKVNKIITNRAPGLSVASAKSADSAKTATSASSASSADSAKNSDALGGLSLRRLSQWAIISSGGAVLQSSGGITSTNTSTGRYQVTFPTAVDNCVFNANGGVAPGTATPATDFSNVFAMVAHSDSGPNSIRIETDNDAGALQNEPLYVSVQC